MDKLTFYFDRNIGRSLPEALRLAKPPFDVEFHPAPGSRFAHDMSDDEWLSIVGQHGWIVFSHDRKYHKITAEVSAIKQFDIGCFYLWGAEATTWGKLCAFTKWSPDIIDLARITRRPFIFNVPRSGRIEPVALA